MFHGTLGHRLVLVIRGRWYRYRPRARLHVVFVPVNPVSGFFYVMESVLVNWEALDALVVDFVKCENLIEGCLSSSSSSCSSPTSSNSSSSFNSRLIIFKIRLSLEAGDIDAAINILLLHAPFVLDDRRLLFRLQKQKFIEILRISSANDRDSAINCLRTSLAPCALDAYPEAYEEFKHVLLTLIYHEDDASSPVANEWSKSKRFEIAGLMCSVLRAHLHAYDPVLSMALRYLISIHKGFCLHHGITSPISNLTERLLLEERDPPALPHVTLCEMPPFDEVDIQALAHAVELTRQGAVDSLRFFKGDLYQAFQNELCRMKLDLSLLDELVHEYCIYRGIVDTGIGSTIDPGYSIPKDFSIELSTGLRKGLTDTTMCSGNQFGIKRDGIEGSCCFEEMDNSDNCSSSSNTQHFEKYRYSQRNRNTRTMERGRHKRWKERHDKLEADCVPEILKFTPFPSTDLRREVQDDKLFSSLLEIKELTSKGFVSEVVEKINSTYPDFFVDNHVLHFQLKQIEFLRLVGTGDISGALKFASTHLGPLAAYNPSLLKTLKQTLLSCLRPDRGIPLKGTPLTTLASSLQVAIGRRMGVEEPKLMKIMKATLYTHNEWFKLQMCKDRFDHLLRIDSVKEEAGIAPFLDFATAPAMNSTEDIPSSSSSQCRSFSGNQTCEGTATEPLSILSACDENAILKVMEFLALPRAEAIHLLNQNNGNAETVIQQLFA